MSTQFSDGLECDQFDNMNNEVIDDEVHNLVHQIESETTQDGEADSILPSLIKALTEQMALANETIRQITRESAKLTVKSSKKVVKKPKEKKEEQLQVCVEGLDSAIVSKYVGAGRTAVVPANLYKTIENMNFTEVFNKLKVFTGEDTAGLLTPLELAIHNKAKAEGKQRMMVDSKLIPKLLQRKQNMNLKQVYYDEKNDRDIELNFQLIKTMSYEGLINYLKELGFYKISETNENRIEEELTKFVCEYFPWSDSKLVVKDTLRAIWNLTNYCVYREIKNTDILSQVELEVVEHNGKYYTSEEAEKLICSKDANNRKEKQILIGGTLEKTSSVIRRLYEEPSNLRPQQ